MDRQYRQRIIRGWASILLSIVLAAGCFPVYVFAESADSGGTSSDADVSSSSAYDAAEEPGNVNDTSRPLGNEESGSADEAANSGEMYIDTGVGTNGVIPASESGIGFDVSEDPDAVPLTKADLKNRGTKKAAIDEDASSAAYLEQAGISYALNADSEGTDGSDGMDASEEPVYTLTDGVLTVSGTGTVADNLYKGNTEITELVFEDGITGVGSYAFYGCKNLKTVTFPATLTTIGNCAFRECTTLEAAILPEGVNEIGEYAFASDTKLQEVYVPLSIQDASVTYSYNDSSYKGWGIFNGCSNLTTVNFAEGTTYIHSGLFAGTGITNLVLPETLTGIGKYAFANCSKLETVDFPDALTEIKDGAFGSCTKIGKLELTEGITTIGAGAFNNDTALTEVYIPLSVQTGSVTYSYNTSSYKAWGIFSGCPKLTTINLAVGTTYIHSGLFAGTGITNIVLPDGVTAVNKFAFANCSKLSSVTFPEGEKLIGEYAFSTCPKLAELNNTEGLTEIQESAFRNDTSLTAFNFPQSLETIGAYSLAGTGITHLSIPETLTTIGVQAFSECKSLTEADLSVQMLEGKVYKYSYNSSSYKAWGPFSECTSLTTVNFPDGITYIPRGLFAGSGITEIELPDTIEEIGSYAFSNSSLSKIDIPDSVTTIGFCAFSGCESLAEVDLPTGWNLCRSFDDSTGTGSQGRIFFNCSKLTDIVLPDGLEMIPDYAFANCNYINNVIVPDSVKSIGQYAYYKCTSLTSAKIPEGVQTVSESSMNGCDQLLTVVVPMSVTSVENDAFSGCSSLTSINYAGSQTAWNDISIGESDSSDINDVVVNYDFNVTYTADDFVGTWEGEYDGNSNSTIVRRHFVYIVDTCEETRRGIARMTGTRSISQSLENPSSLYAVGSDAVNGAANLQTGTLTFQGYTWIEYPVGETTYDSFNHMSYSGYLDIDKAHMYGTVGGYSNRTFWAELITDGKRNYTKVICSMGDEKYDLLSELLSIVKDSDTYVTIIVQPDWGEAEPGVFRLFQKDVSIESRTGVFLDIRPGKIFAANKPVYISLTDSEGQVVFTEKLRLNIASDEDEAAENTSISEARTYGYRKGVINDGGAVQFHYYEEDFADSSYTYNHDMARMSSALALMAYGTRTHLKNLLVNGMDYKDFYTWDKDFKDDIGVYSPFAIAHKEVYLEGEKTEIVLIIIRGTYHKEWMDDFELGTDTIHQGFQKATDKILTTLNSYIKKKSFDSDANLKILVTGHSRGAAVANLVGKYLDDGCLNSDKYQQKDVFSYAFAAPNSSKASNRFNDEYKNLFCIVNPEDFVTKVAPSKWGYGRYGITYVLPSATTEVAGTANYVDYETYLQKLVDKSSETHPKTAYYPYDKGMHPVVNYVDYITSNVWNTDAYYKKGLRNNTYHVLEPTDSLHILYKYGLGGFLSGDSFYEAAAKATFVSIAVPTPELTPGHQIAAPTFGAVGIRTAAFFIVNHVIDPHFDNAHTPETYYAAMNVLLSRQLKQQRKTLKGIVNCPVDVTVSDAEGKVIGRIENNKVDESITDGITMDVDGDSKIFYLPAESKYDVSLTGNDSGTMDYSLCEVDADNGEISRKIYENVPVEKGAKMTQAIDAAADVSVVKLVDDKDAIVSEGAYLNGDSINNLNVEVDIEGIGSANSCEGLTAGDYVTLSAVTDSNNSFLGWYDADGNLVTKEDAYSFSIHENMKFTARFTNNVVDVTGISAEEGSISIKELENAYNPVTVEPANATYTHVTYSSADENVATVNEVGVVTGTGEGTTVITAADESGQFTAQYEVKVSHNWNEGEVKTAATCTRAGTKVYTCKNCGETKSEAIPATGHQWNKEYFIDKIATCTEDGEESIHCSKCDATKDRRSIPKTIHHYSSWTTIKKATEIATGQQSHKCIICGKTKTRTIPQLAPTLKTIKITKPKAAKKAISVKWKKVSKKNLKKIKKVQIQYSLDKSFKTGVKTKYAKAKKTSLKIKGLKSKKKYYVRIRAYTKSGSTVHVSKWSAVKRVKIK